MPNKRIVTGQRPGSAEASVSESAPAQKTATLGLLAQGFSGIVAWRKEEENGQVGQESFQVVG